MLEGGRRQRHVFADGSELSHDLAGRRRWPQVGPGDSKWSHVVGGGREWSQVIAGGPRWLQVV